MSSGMQPRHGSRWYCSFRRMRSGRRVPKVQRIPPVAHTHHARSGVQIGSYGAPSALSVVGVDAFQVGEHDIVVKAVLMLRAGVLDYGVGHRVLVVTAELASASGALLLVLPDAKLTTVRMVVRPPSDAARRLARDIPQCQSRRGRTAS